MSWLSRFLFFSEPVKRNAGGLFLRWHPVFSVLVICFSFYRSLRLVFFALFFSFGFPPPPPSPNDPDVVHLLVRREDQGHTRVFNFLSALGIPPLASCILLRGPSICKPPLESFIVPVVALVADTWLVDDRLTCVHASFNVPPPFRVQDLWFCARLSQDMQIYCSGFLAWPRCFRARVLSEPIGGFEQAPYRTLRLHPFFCQGPPRCG